MLLLFFMQLINLLLHVLDLLFFFYKNVWHARVNTPQKTSKSYVVWVNLNYFMEGMQIIQRRSLITQKFLVQWLECFCTSSFKQFTLFVIIAWCIDRNLVIVLNLFYYICRNLLTFLSTVLIKNVHLLLSILRMVLFYKIRLIFFIRVNFISFHCRAWC